MTITKKNVNALELIFKYDLLNKTDMHIITLKNKHGYQVKDLVFDFVLNEATNLKGETVYINKEKTHYIMPHHAKDEAILVDALEVINLYFELIELID